MLTFSPQAARVERLRVLTVNTHKGFSSFNRRFTLPELRDAVRSVSADVVFLQEVLGTHQRHARRVPNWPQTPQYEFLADSIWSDFAYGRNAVYPHGDHGNALLSKYPIIQWSNKDISLSGPERRGLLHSIVQLPGHKEALHTICVHLSLRESHRQQQLHQLCQLIASLPPKAPLIIAGDFNDWRHQARRQLEKCAGLQEAFNTLHGEFALSFPARWPLLRLDRIYLRHLTPVSAKTLSNAPWSHLSDHLALSVELRF